MYCCPDSSNIIELFINGHLQQKAVQQTILVYGVSTAVSTIQSVKEKFNMAKRKTSGQSNLT